MYKLPNAVDLPRPDAQALVVLGNRNAVGFRMLDDLPRQHQILHLLFRRLRFGHDLQVAVFRQQLVVDFLHQQAARHFAHHAFALRIRADRRIQFQQAQILFLRQNRHRFLGELRRNDDLKEDFAHLLSRRRVHRAVGDDNAAEHADRIGLIRQLVSLADRLRHAHAARVAMLDRNDRRRVKLAQQFQRAVCVVDVVVGKLLAVQLPGRRERARDIAQVAIERRFLVRVLAVTHLLHLFKRDGQVLREFRRVLQLAAQVLLNHAVILRGMLKDLILQIALGFQRNVARGFQLGEHAVVIRRIDDDDHILRIFCRRAKHGRTADIDVLNRLVEGHAGLFNGRAEVWT